MAWLSSTQIRAPSATRAAEGSTVYAGLAAIRCTLMGALLTGLMVFLFLGDVRGAMIVVMTIPIAIITAVIAADDQRINTGDQKIPERGDNGLVLLQSGFKIKIVAPPKAELDSLDISTTICV